MLNLVKNLAQSGKAMGVAFPGGGSDLRTDLALPSVPVSGRPDQAHPGVGVVDEHQMGIRVLAEEVAATTRPSNPDTQDIALGGVVVEGIEADQPVVEPGVYDLVGPRRLEHRPAGVEHQVAVVGADVAGQDPETICADNADGHEGGQLEPGHLFDPVTVGTRHYGRVPAVVDAAAADLDDVERAVWHGCTGPAQWDDAWAIAEVQQGGDVQARHVSRQWSRVAAAGEAESGLQYGDWAGTVGLSHHQSPKSLFDV